MVKTNLDDTLGNFELLLTAIKDVSHRLLASKERQDSEASLGIGCIVG